MTFCSFFRCIGEFSLVLIAFVKWQEKQVGDAEYYLKEKKRNHSSFSAINHILGGCHNMSIQKLKTYTVKEAAKIISVPTGTIKRWEQDLADFLIIPRTKQGARYFTELELKLLKKIKQLRDNNISLDVIASSFQPKSAKNLETTSEDLENPTEVEPLIDLLDEKVSLVSSGRFAGEIC